MNPIEKYHVYDLLNEPENIINVVQEDIHKVWPEGFFDYTDTLYDRKALRINPWERKQHKSLEESKIAKFGNEIAQYRAYFEAGTQLLPYVDCIKGKHVLDIGCGNGDLAFAMEQLGAASVTGADVHQENIDICNKIKNKFNSKIKFETRDVNDLTVEYLKQFDTVMAFQCLSWTNCHGEFFKNTNKAGVHDLIMTETLKGLPAFDCMWDRAYNVRLPMLVLYHSEGYHYGGTGWKDNKTCLRAETNLPFWVEALDYYGWYVQDWSWQKNCTLNNIKPSIATYQTRFVFHCITTTKK